MNPVAPLTGERSKNPRITSKIEEAHNGHME
jgi:hypothetical protein